MANLFSIVSRTPAGFALEAGVRTAKNARYWARIWVSSGRGVADEETATVGVAVGRV